MASNLNLSVFDFTTEQVRAINELVYDEVLRAPDINFLHTIFPNIVTDKFIGFIGEGDIVGKLAQGCDPTPQDWSISARQKKWSPKGWEVFLNECYKDIENTMAIYSLNKGVDKADLTNTDYMAIVVEVLSMAIKKMIWRLVWFSDTAAANYASGGFITDGVDITYFNLLDGLWKQLIVQTTANPAQRVTIAANAQATTALQYSTFTGLQAYEALNALHLNSPITLRGAADSIFICTQSFADAYMTYLEGKELESTYVNLVDGINALSFRGVPVIPVPLFDEMILRYENSGTKLNSLHRCLYIQKSNIAVGTPSNGVLAELDVWYDKTTRKNYMYATDSIDAMILNESLFTLAI